MKKELSDGEIIELSRHMVDIFKIIAKMKQKYVLAKYIQYPKIPPILSESICLKLLKKKIILEELKDFSFEFGGNLSDILAKKSKTKKIEVKSTGKSGFQKFGKGDISCDYLIWIHFDKAFYENNFNNIHIFIINCPSRYFDKPTNTISLESFKKKVPDLIDREFSFTTIFGI
jgi:hypothetical protein